MPNRPRILVIGATGTVGGELLRLLAERSHAVRALSRSGRGQDRPGVTWVGGDLADPARLRAVLDGIERVFLLTGNVEGMVRLQMNAIRAAREAGVLHVVKLSALGASDHSLSLIGVWHWIVERALEVSGLAWTILRPHHFMQNLLEQRQSIVEEGLVRSPAGDGKIPFIDTRDIAAVAAQVLTEPGHAGRTYMLTGPEALSYREATAILAAETGRALRFEDESPVVTRARMSAAGRPEWLIGAQLAIAAYQRGGGTTERTTATVQEVTGRPARTFREFARDHADRFR